MAARYFGVAPDAEGVADPVTAAGATTGAVFEFVIADTAGDNRQKKDAIFALERIMAKIIEDEAYGNV